MAEPDQFAPLQFNLRGRRVLVEPLTFTGSERQEAKAATLRLVEPDAIDSMFIMVWVALRRSDPRLTLDEVLATYTVGEMLAALGGED